MEYRLLGRTGTKISRLAFGTMTFGREADRDASHAMFKRCLDAGINMFDCANVYSKGKAESILGECMAGIRHELVISSKVHFSMGSGVNDRGSSRKHIAKQIEDSLGRLKTDFIDIYFLHCYDSDTPLEEVLRVMDDLVRQGKVLYVGASNFSAWQIAKALGVSARMGFSPIHVIQPMYNIVKRTAEIEILHLALAENLGVVSYNPLGAGLLTGKYFTNEAGAADRLNTDQKYKVRYGEEHAKDAAARFCEFAKAGHMDPAALAIAWVMKHPAITAPLLGARNLAQLEGCLGALDINMTDDLYSAITALSVPVPPATDRNDG